MEVKWTEIHVHINENNKNFEFNDSPPADVKRGNCPQCL
jgi:hypothetical protein